MTIHFMLLFYSPWNSICLSPSLQSDRTCVGDGILLPASASGREGQGRRPGGDPWFTDCSGDRLQMLSSSHDELLAEVLGDCVSERDGRGCGDEGDRKGLAVENINASSKRASVFFTKKSYWMSVPVCVHPQNDSQAFINCIYRCWASGFLPTIQTYWTVTPWEHP